MTMEEARRYCLKLERDRGHSRRRYVKGKFQDSMLHIEHDFDFQRIENSDDDPRNAWISDRGAGAKKVRSFDERKHGSYYTRRIKAARRRLARNFPELVEVFNLVVKNGKNRRESIAYLTVRHRISSDAAKVRYWGHLKKISLFFETPQTQGCGRCSAPRFPMPRNYKSRKTVA